MKLLSIFMIFLVIILFSGCVINREKYIQEELTVDVAEIQGSTSIRMINKDVFDWNNVHVVVNNKYSCWDIDTVIFGEDIYVDALNCDDFAINQTSITSVSIISDEGRAHLMR